MIIKKTVVPLLLFVLFFATIAKSQTVEEDRQRVIELIGQIDNLLAPMERDLRDRWRELYDSLIVVEQNSSEEMRQRILTRRVLASNQHQQMTQIRSQSNNLRRLLTELRDDLDIGAVTDIEAGIIIIELTEEIQRLEQTVQQLDEEVVHLTTQVATATEQAAENWTLVEALRSQVDSLMAGVIPDTVWYPSYQQMEIAFNDVPPEWRRVDRIVIRPVGWAAGTVKLKGSDDPWWTQIEKIVSTGDIWGVGDYMMFMNIPTTEWTYAYAMLDSLIVMDHRARTGLHIRQSYEPGSPFVFLAYQNGRASVNMRNEWGGEVTGHPGGGFEVALPIGLQVNMTDQGFDARLYDVWTDSLVHSWSLPNVFEDRFYTGIATTSWRTDYITKAYYSLLNILDATPWNETCRDDDGNLTDCPEEL